MCVHVCESIYHCDVMPYSNIMPTHPQMKVQDLGKENALVAHFVAHADSDVHIAGLAFNPRYAHQIRT